MSGAPAHPPSTAGAPRKRLHLAVRFPGAERTAVRSDHRFGPQIDFASFSHLADTAERGLFDFLFLAEGLRLCAHQGLIHDLAAVGCPESLTVLSALAGVTERIGLAATVDATFNEPYEPARRLASLDHLSGGRAAWHVLTSSDASTGQNFRRGGRLDQAGLLQAPGSARTEGTVLARAAEFIAVARGLWDSWTPNGRQRPFAHQGRHFDIAGGFTVPRCPQGHPVIIQAGDSPEGRDVVAATADVIFTRHGTLETGRQFYADMKGRLGQHGRRPTDLKIMPDVGCVLGDTEAEAQERAAEIRRRQVPPRHAIFALEEVWGMDLSSFDPDGPLPDFDPDPGSAPVHGGGGLADRLATARKWRAVAQEKGLSIRQTVIEMTRRQSFVGTPGTVAAQMDALVQNDAADGFVLIPHLMPGGLDEFVAKVVPLLQERGVFRTRYTGTTLRSHLGLDEPVAMAQ